MKLTCDGCPATATKAEANAGGWTVLEVDGQVRRTYCGACLSRCREMQARCAGTRMGTIVSVRPTRFYQVQEAA